MREDMLMRYDWQPGNGTRYDLFYGKTPKKSLISWMKKGGSGGVTCAFSGYLHYTYLMEKMEVNIADAVGILKFLDHMGFEVGYPNSQNYEMCTGTPRIKVID